jgi:periplasmic divalent cation tolerance protein
MTVIAVLTTTGTLENAQQLAKALVDARLAACAQISQIESVYTWQGEVQQEKEFRILFKTTAERYEQVEKAICDLHSYELPAILALPVSQAYAPFVDWVEENSSGEE